MSHDIPPALAGARFVPVPSGEKIPGCKWLDIRLCAAEAQRCLDRGTNLALRLGRDSGGIVDADFDCDEARFLAPLYLPATGARFGRSSKPGAHWLYHAPGTVYAALSDPLDGTMLLELRADGREGGAHLSLIPPSTTGGERREWEGEVVEPAKVDAAALARRIIWLGIGCLVLRHVSENAARQLGPHLPAILWEADPTLGRAAYHWLGKRAPDEPQNHPKHRRDMSREELDLAQLVGTIRNSFNWTEWNRVGMAIYSASRGSGQGFIAFDDLSARSPKYNQLAVRERWRNYRRSPPSRIGIGTLVHLAREAGWQRGDA